MVLRKNELDYLKPFHEEVHKAGSSGFLDVEEAGRRAGIDFEGGHLALRLAKLGYLEQKKGSPDFSITKEGEEMLVSTHSNIGRITHFFKDHLLGMIIFSVITSLVAGLIYSFFNR